MKYVLLLISLLYAGSTIAFDDDHTACTVTPEDKVSITDAMSGMNGNAADKVEWTNIFGTAFVVEHVATYQNDRGLLCRTVAVEVGDRMPVEIEGCHHRRRGWQIN